MEGLQAATYLISEWLYTSLFIVVHLLDRCDYSLFLCLCIILSLHAALHVVPPTGVRKHFFTSFTLSYAVSE